VGGLLAGSGREHKGGADSDAWYAGDRADDLLVVVGARSPGKGGGLCWRVVCRRRAPPELEGRGGPRARGSEWWRPSCRGCDGWIKSCRGGDSASRELWGTRWLTRELG
jgi:hypothetical protein